MEKRLEELNSHQKEAVLDESRACIVNANVGSGKTTVLIAKIKYLHEVKHVDYEDMIVLTFTNKAADEIKERMTAGEDGIKGEQMQGFGTFHSVALNFLRGKLPVESLGFTKEFLVIDPDEELDLAMHLITEHKFQIKYKNRLKKRLEQAMSVEEEARRVSRYGDDIFPLAAALQEEKIRQDKMSFSDLLGYAAILLKTVTWRPKWVIIDEVQDCDRQQLEWIDTLMSEETNLFAVGDPNQVIYSWRGGSENVFYKLRTKYEARELSLPLNYRSSRWILEAAGRFQQLGERVQGVRESEHKIRIRRQYDPFNEACYLAGKIRKIHEAGVPYREMAVFYRLQMQSQVLEEVFKRQGIPYEVSQKKTIHDIPVLDWVIKVLKFSVNQKDMASGIAALSNKNYGVGVTEKKARTFLMDSEKEQPFLREMREFSAACQTLESAEEMYQYFDLDSRLHPTSADYAADSSSVRELFEMIIKYCRENEKALLEGTTDFISSSALYGIRILKEDLSSEEDSVKLMTLHASKGLEFTCVFIIGVNHGLIPLQGNGPDGEEEEQRLFFVGMTRAKEYLELSCYTNLGYYRTMPGESRYLRMIPENLVVREDGETEKVDLRDLKKQVQAAKNEMQESGKGLPEPEEEKMQELKKRRVRHKKYGTGVVVREDEMMIEAEFAHYGVKEFVKAFSELEYED